MKSHQIYPKEFKDEKLNIKRNFCFVITPFANEQAYKKIQKAAKSCNYECFRSDGFVRSDPFLNAIMSSIKQAYFLIVDISHLNPNVFYELGIAHTLRSSNKILILKDKKTKCPSDIIHMNYYEYDENNYNSISPIVIDFIKKNNITCDLEELFLYANLANEKTIQKIVSCVENELSLDLINIIYILNNSLDKIECKDVETILFNIWNIILEQKFSNDNILNDFYINLFLFLLQKTIKKYELKNIIRICLTEIDNHEIREIQADIVAQLIITDPNLEVLSWTNNFLMNCSPAGVDIIKFKLQVAIINSRSLEIERFLINNLENNLDKMENKKICTLVEHTLNLCKEKNMKNAILYALRYIDLTTNPYVFRSAMDLIFKIGDKTNFCKYISLIEKRIDLIQQNVFLNDRLAVITKDYKL